jgi:hypothetical protein
MPDHGFEMGGFLNNVCAKTRHLLTADPKLNSDAMAMYTIYRLQH